MDSVDDEFIECIEFLINNSEERKRIGKNARSLAEQRYHQDEIGDSRQALYEKLLVSA
jgi:glycosyltransferase involved in cell wall biosynthesis